MFVVYVFFWVSYACFLFTCVLRTLCLFVLFRLFVIYVFCLGSCFFLLMCFVFDHGFVSPPLGSHLFVFPVCVFGWLFR